MTRGPRFLLVGAIGFLTEAGLLSLMGWLADLGPYLPRLVSLPCAVSVTWYLNRIWSFADRSGAVAAQYGRYAAVQTCGALINLATYAAVIAVGGRWMEQILVLPLAIASAAALAFNFLGARRWVFVGDRPR